MEAVYFKYILIAYGLDLLIGDPRWMFHPIRCMGKIIVMLEEFFGFMGSTLLVKLKGILTVFIVVVFSCGLTAVILLVAKAIHPFYYATCWVILSYFTLAVKDLVRHAQDIIVALKDNNIELARDRLSLIVGRDTQNLKREQIIKATIESISENTSDGIVAPLFYLFLGGPILAMGYKAINTLDSMIGYKNETYQHFGWFAAKLDDLFNWIPARLTGFSIVCVAFITRRNGLKSYQILRRDGKKHLSPNSAIPESAMAGALQIQLGGNYYYQGIEHKGQLLGDAMDNIDVKKVSEALYLSLLVSIVMMFLWSFVIWII